jgi:D5 N terminal like
VYHDYKNHQLPNEDADISVWLDAFHREYAALKQLRREELLPKANRLDDLARGEAPGSMRKFFFAALGADCRALAGEKIIEWGPIFGLNLNSDDSGLATLGHEAVAPIFVERHAGDLRYVAKWGRWMTWTGHKWAADETVSVYDLARRVCREVATKLEEGKLASSACVAPFYAAVEKIARSDRALAATVDQWDADPWLLNTPGGVVDLRAGKLRLHDPADFMTKMTAVAPGGKCTRWLAFLDRITGSDADLIDYLQRVIGYVLTGEIKEHAIFWGASRLAETSGCGN